jgi:hypothetical protein
VKNVIVNILAAPFRAIGNLFTSGDKISGFSIDPVRFDPGAAGVNETMDAQIKRLSEFLGNTPAIRISLTPVLSEPDILAVKTQEVTARLQRVQREERYGTLGQAADSLFRKRFPNRKVPENVEGIVAAFRDVEPPPNEAAQKLAARRVEAVRERLGAAGTDAKRMEAAEKSPPPDATGDGRVEFSILP